MKRMKVLFGNRRMMVMLTLAILVLAAAAVIASSASFSATSANVTNTFTAGNLTLTDTQALTFQNLKMMPGHSITGSAQFDVVSDGGPSTLYMQQTADLSANAFAGRVRVTVVLSDGVHAAATYGPYVVNSGALASGVVVGNIADTGATPVSYTANFTAEFIQGDSNVLGGNPAPGSVDNGFRNATCSPVFVFTAITD